MSNNNNNANTSSKMPEPTMSDLYKLMEKCAQRDDLLEVKASIDQYTEETNEKIRIVSDRVDAVSNITNQNTEKIESLEATVEQLKQEQLKNNICISGIPPSSLENTDTADIVIEIAKKLGCDLNKSQFNSYAIANKKFIIAQYYNIKHKQLLLSKIRAKRSLMVEEVLNTTSNSQIYLNDHLTAHFNKLYTIARNAKKNGLLESVSSLGGKIRARKSKDDQLILIYSETQLRTLIEIEPDNTTTMLNTDCAGTSSRQQNLPITKKKTLRSNSTTRRNAQRTTTATTTTTGKRHLEKGTHAPSKKPNNNS